LGIINQVSPKRLKSVRKLEENEAKSLFKIPVNEKENNTKGFIKIPRYLKFVTVTYDYWLLTKSVYSK